MKKNINALYFSATGSVKRVVKTLASGLDKDYREYDITRTSNRQGKLCFSKDDLVVVGVPVYRGRVPILLREYFKEIRGENTLAVFVVVYGNRDYEDALLELKDIFEERGFIGLAACSFIGEHSYATKVGTDRPDDIDLEIALDFSQKIKKKLETLSDIEDIEYLFVRGNIPYREDKLIKEFIPITDSSCIECGICERFCPTDAIDKSNYSKIDETKCITCCSCVKRCPVDAKQVEDEQFIMMKDRLIENHTIRREPELFI